MERGAHHLVESQLCNYLMREPVDTVTGQGFVHLGGSTHPYNLLREVVGQEEVVLAVMKPVTVGFQKRLSVAFASEATAQEDCSVAEAAGAVIQGFSRLDVS